MNEFIYLFIFMENDNTSVILSWLLYKALQVEFISRKEC